MGLELATGALAGATLRLNEIHEHPFLPYGIFAEHSPLTPVQNEFGQRPYLNASRVLHNQTKQLVG
jgi:hypothetical protein